MRGWAFGVAATAFSRRRHASSSEVFQDKIERGDLAPNRLRMLTDESLNPYVTIYDKSV